jgi:hypothetical protein
LGWANTPIINLGVTYLFIYLFIIFREFNNEAKYFPGDTNLGAGPAKAKKGR